METFFKTSFEAIKKWILGVFSANGFINAGWLAAGVALLVFGFPLFGGISLGIFGEKNRKQLVELYKKVKSQI